MAELRSAEARIRPSLDAPLGCASDMPAVMLLLLGGASVVSWGTSSVTQPGRTVTTTALFDSQRQIQARSFPLTEGAEVIAGRIL